MYAVQVIDSHKPTSAVVHGDGMRAFTFKVKLRDDRRNLEEDRGPGRADPA